MDIFKPTRYKLQSIVSGEIFEDEGWMLTAKNESRPTLIRAIYENEQIDIKDDSWGLYKYADWLPVHRMLEGSSAPVTYKSEALAEKLGLKNLFITFSGYWPEKGATMRTGTFKETEAYAVGGRISPDEKRRLVVASAGNTARAFARVCSDNKIPLLLAVPEDNVESAMWFDKPIDEDYVTLISSKGSDYFDAIHLGNIACELDDKFFPEGGAKNVARREGMGTTMLSAAEFIGQIPRYYFQGVGSGTGAVSAWEAALRLEKDGNFGENNLKLLVSQNLPFKILQDAWRADSRELLPMDDNIARDQVAEIVAKVLSNRKPPYPPAGGLYDALKDTDGDVLTASNEEAHKASELFKELEGNDIDPAAAVALATLIKSAENNEIDKNEIVMLNITGGGKEKFLKENKIFTIKPKMVFDIEPDTEFVKKELRKI